MKITKRQLRRIIKEEKARILQLREAGPGSAVGDYPRDARDWVEMLGQLIDQDMSERGVWYEQEGAAIMQALEQLRYEIKDKSIKSDYR